LEGNGRGLFEVIPLLLSGGIVENEEKLRIVGVWTGIQTENI
jgi:hypothetical protein